MGARDRFAWAVGRDRDRDREGKTRGNEGTAQVVEGLGEVALKALEQAKTVEIKAFFAMARTRRQPPDV